MTLSTQRQRPFQVNLEDRINTVVSALLNSELKALTVACGLSDVLVDKNEIRASLRKIVKSNVWLPGPDTFEAYFEKSFFPAGVVSESVSGEIKDSVVKWALTSEGQRYGIPLAVLGLNYAVSHKVSLQSLLGSSRSSGARSGVYNRLRIIEQVTDGLRSVDLERVLSLESEGVMRHLLALQEAGLLHYESVDTEKDRFSTYKWVECFDPANVKPVKHYPALTARIVSLCVGRNGIYYKDLAKELKIISSGAVGGINTVINALVRQGVLEVENFRSVHALSRVTLNSGISAAKDLVSRARLILSDTGDGRDERRYWIGQWEELINDRQALTIFSTKAAQLYEAVSSNKNRRPMAETNKRIVDYVVKYTGENGFGPRPSEIGISVGLDHPGVYLKPLRDKGILDCERIKKPDGEPTKAVRYSVCGV